MLEAYYFHKKDWKSWEELYNSFKWVVPEYFNIAEYVCDQWANDKSKVALFYEDLLGREGKITYWELKKLANKLANILKSLGVKRGDRVGIILPQIPETAIAHIACWKMGAISVPLSTLFGPEAIQYRLNDCGAKVCILDESKLDTFRKIRDKLPALEHIIVVGETTPESELNFWDSLSNAEPSYENTRTKSEEDAIIIYTSGTTGDPKGTVHAHRVLLGHLPMFLTTWCNLEITPSDLAWTPSEWAWIASLFDVLFPSLFYGIPVLSYYGGKFDPERTFELIEKYGVTIFFAPPTALRIMMQIKNPEERYDLDSVRVVVSGGESMGSVIPQWAKKVFPNATVHEAYGQTEANLLVGNCTKLLEFRGDWIGKPGVGHIVKILDPETGEVLGSGEVGEIAVKATGDPVVFKYYWNKPEKTREKFRGEWLLTEDLGVMDEKGYIQFKGRKDDVIKCSGYRIGPEEIEKALAKHNAVAMAAVIGVSDPVRGQVPKAFIVLSEGYKPSEELKKELQMLVQESIAKFAYPREIEFVTELPMTITGKIKRSELRKFEESRRSTNETKGLR